MKGKMEAESYTGRRVNSQTSLIRVRVVQHWLVDPNMYHKLIGSLNYLVNNSPNICYVVNTLSQFLVEPPHVHWVAAKHVLRYL